MYLANATECCVNEWRLVNQASKAMHTNSRRRPGGRTADVTGRIQQAIVDLIVEGGVDACTFSAVAQRAGIERSTLYRRFPDRWDAIVEAWVARAAQDVSPDLGDSFAEDLTSVLHKLVEILESPAGPAVLRVVAELRGKSDYTQNYFAKRMAQLAPMFEAAIARGELPADVDRDALFAASAGPIYFRMFLAGQSIDEAYIRTIVNSICRLYCLPGDAPKLPLAAAIP